MKCILWTLVCLTFIAAPDRAQKQSGDELNARAVSSGRLGLPRHPDIILVTIDTLRADHVGCYGYRSVRTPALNELARDGIRFANACTPSPITNSSHASIMTGLLPSAHGVLTFGAPLAPGASTLAEAMKAHGFATAAFIGAVILDKP